VRVGHQGQLEQTDQILLLAARTLQRLRRLAAAAAVMARVRVYRAVPVAAAAQLILVPLRLAAQEHLVKVLLDTPAQLQAVLAKAAAAAVQVLQPHLKMAAQEQHHLLQVRPLLTQAAVVVVGIPVVLAVPDQAVQVVVGQVGQHKVVVVLRELQILVEAAAQQAAQAVQA